HGVQGAAGQRSADLEVPGQVVGAQQLGHECSFPCRSRSRSDGPGPSEERVFTGVFSPGPGGCVGSAVYFRHRTLVSSRSTSTGTVVSHRDNFTGQRGANRQPFGITERSGGAPGIPFSGTLAPLMLGNASSSPR